MEDQLAVLTVVQTIANRTLSGDSPLKEANESLEICRTIEQAVRGKPAPC
jgi:hypothetical protein